MTPVLIALALVLGSAAALQEPSKPSALRIGESVTGELPLRIEGGHNAAQAIFELTLERDQVFTVTLESLDFNARLSIVDPVGGAAAEDLNSGIHTNAWLVHESKGPAKLVVKAGAEDARGGEFVLSVRAGRVNPPPRTVAWGRKTVEHCEAVAARAQALGERDRAFSFLSQACQYAAANGDFGRAQSIAERHLHDAQAAAVPLEIVRGRAHLGATERQLGNPSRAAELLEAARSGAEEALAAARQEAEEREITKVLCLIHGQLGELTAASRGEREALPFFRRAVELAPKTGSAAIEAPVWQKLGEALLRLGELPEAAQAIEKGLAAAESIENPRNPRLLSGLLLSHGRLLALQGDPVESRRQCERALTLSPLPLIRIDILGTLAGVCIDLGRYENAVHAMDELESLCAENGVKDYEIPTRINRALIALKLGDPGTARRLLEEASSLPEAGGSPAQLVDLLLDLGRMLSACGDSEAARARYEEALEICERIGDHVTEAKVLLNLGGLHQDRRDFAAAGGAYDRSAELAQAAGERALAAAARGARGYLLYLTGDFESARVIARAAATELEALEEAEMAVDAHDTLAKVGLAQADFRAVEDALCAAERLFDMQGEQELGRFAAVRLRSRFADWGAIAQELAATRLRSKELDPEARKALAAEGFRQAGLWKGRTLLEGMHIAPRGPAPDRATDPTESFATGKTEALVEYVDGLEKTYAYVAHGGSLRFLDLGERDPIEEHARTLVESLAGIWATPKDHADHATWLYEHLVSPILGELPDDISNLTIVPTPGLSALPFECLVLPLEKGETGERGFRDLKYLIDGLCVTYAPSAPVLAELRRRRRSERTTRCLIMGDPVYRDEAAQGTGGEQVAQARLGSTLFDYERVKHTREETLEIARLFLRQDRDVTDAQRSRLLEIPDSRTASMPAGLFDLYLGADAQGKVLRGDLSAYTELHIAAHGHVDPADPRHSGIVLSYEPSSGGLFPLEDVLGLQLDADLVVLSACDTARGPVVRGEGVESLAYAFLEAGSRSVVASLWKVEDRDAAVIMKRFHALRIGKEMGSAQALRAAKLEFRRSREVRGRPPVGEDSGRMAVAANPYYWAPFIYVGAP